MGMGREERGASDRTFLSVEEKGAMKLRDIRISYLQEGNKSPGDGLKKGVT